ncbi:MAG TPA: purine-nucleoside phosphorylase [Pirellulales bacterium]|jgi:purine-nucleoside phosphorylase|nr:purine-nucleoside phosphorylase [Pirellulales bacterium]
MQCKAIEPSEAKILEAVAWIRRRWNGMPRAGLILGTGLGHFADEVQAETILPYESIPHFERATALGHRGRLVCGHVANLPVVVMDGRLHAYEGYSFAEITFPTRVIHALGIELLIVTNSAGGLNPQYSPGDILLIADHINLMFGTFESACATGQQRRPVASQPARHWPTSLASATQAAAGLSSNDALPITAMRPSPYDPSLLARAAAIARRANFVAHQGVYIAVTGPNYETRAEYRFLRRIGGDAVGMSTVPEVTVAAQLGLRILALSTITNLGLPDAPHKTHAADVIAAAAKSEPKVRWILLEILASESSREYCNRPTSDELDRARSA